MRIEKKDTELMIERNTLRPIIKFRVLSRMIPDNTQNLRIIWNHSG